MVVLAEVYSSAAYSFCSNVTLSIAAHYYGAIPAAKVVPRRRGGQAELFVAIVVDVVV